jgi:hypothetical protein
VPVLAPPTVRGASVPVPTAPSVNGRRRWIVVGVLLLAAVSAVAVWLLR